MHELIKFRQRKHKTKNRGKRNEERFWVPKTVGSAVLCGSSEFKVLLTANVSVAVVHRVRMQLTEHGT